MTRSIALSSMLAVVVMACAGCNGAGAPSAAGAQSNAGDGTGGAALAAAVVTLDANGSTVSLAPGQKLTLRLRNLGDGGYGAWVLATSPDAAILRLGSSTHEPPAPGAPLGNFGQDVFAFQALAAGETRVVATATRPWKGGETETFTLSVVVR